MLVVLQLQGYRKVLSMLVTAMKQEMGDCVGAVSAKTGHGGQCANRVSVSGAVYRAQARQEVERRRWQMLAAHEEAAATISTMSETGAKLGSKSPWPARIAAASPCAVFHSLPVTKSSSRRHTPSARQNACHCQWQRSQRLSLPVRSYQSPPKVGEPY